MLIDISAELQEHYDRVKQIANDARDDEDASFSAKAAAQTALTTLLSNIIKMQAEVITMKHLQDTEKVIIETVKDFCEEKELAELLEKLEQRLALI